ncbi:unnamed protein product [Urochloa humidicola]
MCHAGLIPFPSHRRATDGVTVQSSPGQDAELLPVDSSSSDGHSQRQGGAPPGKQAIAGGRPCRGVQPRTSLSPVKDADVWCSTCS